MFWSPQIRRIAQLQISQIFKHVSAPHQPIDEIRQRLNSLNAFYQRVQFQILIESIARTSVKFLKLRVFLKSINHLSIVAIEIPPQHPRNDRTTQMAVQLSV